MSFAIRKNEFEKSLWVALACLLCFSAVEIIVDGKFFWAALPAMPLLVYLAVRRPFIFPFGAYAFLIPFDAVLSLTGHSTGTTLTKAVGILSMLSLLLKGSFENRFVRPNKVVFFWTVLVLYASSTFVWAIDRGLTLRRIPTALGLLAFYLIVSFYGTERKEWDTLKVAVLLGGFFASIFCIYSYYQGNFYGMDTQRATLMFGNRETNPNNLSFCMLIPIAICIEMLFTGKKLDWKKIFMIIAFATMLFGVIVAGSRAAMLGIGIIFAIFLFSSKRKFTLGLLFTAVSLPMVMFMMRFFMERWQEAVPTGGAGRVTIWRVGIKSLEKYWLTGAGLDNFPVAYTKFVNYVPGFEGFYRASHNIYLEFAVELGIAGIALFFWGLKRHYSLIRSNWQYDMKDRTMLTAAFWALLVMAFFDDFFWEKTFWLFWMMVLINNNLGKTSAVAEREDISPGKYAGAGLRKRQF